MITQEQLDARQVQRITEVKQRVKKELKEGGVMGRTARSKNPAGGKADAGSNLGDGNLDSKSSALGDCDLVQPPIFDVQKRMVVEQEKAILKYLENVAVTLSPNPKLRRRKKLMGK